MNYRYSNTGYILLAMIVERISGKTFSDFLQDNIFKPLGKDSSFLANASKPGDHTDPHSSIQNCTP